jgi:DNA-directed RNA polymerase subunit RPC12/RpoP
MIITCKKCSKRLEIGSDKLQSGSAFKCPNCGNSIRVKLSGDPAPTKPDWMIRANGESYGPYNEDQLKQFVGELRIFDATEVRHPVATKGHWLPASAVDALKGLLAAARESSVMPPPIQKPPKVQVVAKPIAAKPIAAKPILQAAPKPKWLFPWVLLGIWSAWLLIVPAFFLWSVLSYDFVYGDRVFLDGGQNFDVGGWVFASIVHTAMLAVALGAPALIVSIVAYFFIPKPSAIE